MAATLESILKDIKKKKSTSIIAKGSSASIIHLKFLKCVFNFDLDLNLGAEGAQKIAEALEGNTTVTNLSLQGLTLFPSIIHVLIDILFAYFVFWYYKIRK